MKGRFENPNYIPWRMAILMRDNDTCQKCNKKYRKTQLNAHHIKPYFKHPELRYDLTNGMALCKKCHKNEHSNPKYKIMISCECGCGTRIHKYKVYRKEPLRFVRGHNVKRDTKSDNTPIRKRKSGKSRRGYPTNHNMSPD